MRCPARMSNAWSTEALLARLQSRGYQPARDDVEPLFALLATGEREAAELASRALARLGGAAAAEAMARFRGATPVARARLCRLVGRVARDEPAAPLVEFLLERIDDDDEKTARNAALALGKHRDDEKIRTRVERTLIERLRYETPPLLLRAIVEALGKIGGDEARVKLATLDGGGDAELGRILDEARMKLGRTIERVQGGRVRDDVAPGGRLIVHAHCRHGLAKLCADELARFDARVVDEETVSLSLAAPLSSLWSSRTMLRFGFPLTVLPRVPLEDAVVGALLSDGAWAVLRQFTDGPMRYRLEWADGGHRRGLTFRVAARVAAERPAMVNDPTASVWEAVVRESPVITVELWPRGLDDPRFAYRRAHVPASSHPTLAAALARVAGARPDDVVWDPFAGAGTELVERARLGPFARLYGSDADAAALQLARDNLAAAGVSATLTAGDARSFTPPEPPTVIVTNPPMGRRVLDRHATSALYRDFLAHAADVLAPGGRLVWISPRGDETIALAAPLGLRATLRQRVDMAGFWGEIQSFTRGSRAAAKFSARAPLAQPRPSAPPRSRRKR